MKWEKKGISPELVKSISAKYGCDLLAASILVRRGITVADDILFFMEDDSRHLINPFELPGVEDAVERILAAKEEGEKILVFGDRDVDGITATALVTGFLESIGIDVRAKVPEGDEPYGLSIQAVEEFAADYGTLIITVDCGISSTAEIKRAKELGVDVVITDHHNPQEEMPEACAIVNPKLSGSTYPFKELAGCGVAYKLVSALRFALKSELYGQEICLLNTRPLNDSWVVEAVKLRNLAVLGEITETVIPGMLCIGQTRLPAFLEGQQILCWDAVLQKQTIAKIFGTGVEINMLDIAAEIGKEIPSVAGKTLLRIKELSRMAKYRDKEISELDMFVYLFSYFIRKRENLFGADDAQDIQLVTLGTIADIMPLLNENRIIVKQGLNALFAQPRPGISDLLFKMELSGRRVGATEISWNICPVINAAGRMGNPRKALDLLMEKDAKKRDSLANELIRMNEDRKKLGEEVWTLTEPLAANNIELYQNKLAVAYSNSIPRGVTGIMANRLTMRFKVPSLVASITGNIIIASLRSTRGYDLRLLLEPVADLFLDWGGHDFAAGFSISPDNWEDFLERLKSAAPNIELKEEGDDEILELDAELPLSYMTPEIFNTVDLFEPYGEANNMLIFAAKNMRITDISLMGKPELKHVKLTFDTGKFKWPAVYWQAVDKIKRDFDLGDQVDAAFRITRNYYKGNETPQLVVYDIKRSAK